MVDPTAAYVYRLTQAVRGLPTDVAEGVVSGVREELSGLSGTAATERMAELGDPEFIAASARAELPAATRRSESWQYSVMTAALIAVGGILVPLVGWIVGVVLLATSRLWTRSDKLVGSLAAPVLIIVACTIARIAEFGFVVGNGMFSPIASGTMVALVVAPLVSTPYLLVRARKLRAKPQP